MNRSFYNPWRYIIGAILFFILAYVLFHKKEDMALQKMSYFVFGLAVFQLILAGVAYMIRIRNKS